MIDEVSFAYLTALSSVDRLLNLHKLYVRELSGRNWLRAETMDLTTA